ncbi:hypothetical protein AL542_15745 [Grimontia hollisae]|uniref:Uncharacterized protein n=2 Tax=Grimontia hollisae TaxID=673 RepID=D0I690_GRIHO|nr:hypothetical protein [Grimontia hollisae]AMG31641.1 hypothetical protein AL542_15745 [Grimontia hollisae]EEY72159.1 hypothetical protein VHA_001257 [Grimontia hollisae CIP 101886]MDF2186016.1 hypothetical protein [Grimontia hollisae]STO45172.1 Uncharacterised protein [Grimontia hollisae]STO57765.1 Uncharacterised protein [Grimontia hollisae]
MKSLREIVYKTLVENLNVSPGLLSRIETNEPISIELMGGEEIFIHVNDSVLQTFIEIPLKDARSLRYKAPKIIELVQEDPEMFMNIQKEKMVLVTEIDKNKVSIEKDLSDKLTLFNRMASEIKVN